ncbi:type I polyketide synthase [Kibdelosporangium aridum]|uniref:type I polyketide synthase n=1 Tax=Kibdelosporangium aridum TaxID=2030 RepID=UPI0005263CB5
MNGFVAPIAIIGMAGRFPGAADTSEYWQNLRDGKESVRFPTNDELLAVGVSSDALADSQYVKAVALAPDIDMFDAGFFGMTPREAALCDPQIRLFLETAHRAIEDAGYDPERIMDVGVFGSAGVNRYVELHARSDGGAVRSASGMSLGTLNNSDYVATLVSYRLGFRGPSMTVQTACSSSLAAVHLAAQALRNGECEMALAGGADVEFPVGHGHWWAPGSPLSQDGHCRPFDANANGTIFGSGVGVVVLKLLSDAIKDGDHISAVIRGTAINNDGADKIGFSAPGVSGQAAVIAEALAIADVTPAHIGYVEAHSTGTPLGDPIEVAALNQAFRRVDEDLLEPGQCLLGSVKGGVGHLGHAAGVASLIKVALALTHELIPGTVNFREPNPKLELDGSPFRVSHSAQPWPRSTTRTRLAGLNSLGIGGTNVHAIIEEGPSPSRTDWDGRPTLLVWSGKSAAAAEAYRGTLARHFDQHGAAVLTDTAATLRHGRTQHTTRSALVVRDLKSAVAALKDVSSKAVHKGVSGQRNIAFMVPGQGAQYPGMGRSLLANERAFRSSVTECLDLFGDLGFDLDGPWRAAKDDGELRDTRLAQPLLFTMGYAVCRMWIEWGVEPDALVGHSIGELTAATVAGTVDLSDAVQLVSARADAMAEAPLGRMLSIAAPPRDVTALLPPGVVVAAVNGSRQVVVAGPLEKVDAFEAELRAKDFACQRLRTSHAFHSPSMAEAATQFERAFDGIVLRAPNIPLFSAATGRRMTDDEATSPAFWAAQLLRPVQFADAVKALLDNGVTTLIETGPGRTLTSLARQHVCFSPSDHLAVATLPERGSTEELVGALEAAATLWTNGTHIEWRSVDQGAPVRRLSVPGYQYQRTRHWAGEDVAAATPVDVSPKAAPREAPGPVSYLSWVDSPLRETLPPRRDVPTLVLLPPDEDQSLRLVAALQRAGCDVIPVRQADAFAETALGFLVGPDSADDFDRVFAAIALRGDAVERVVHASAMGKWAKPTSAEVRGQLELAFHSLHAVVRSSSRSSAGTLPDLLVVADSSVDVSGGEPVDPVKAALHGAVRTLAIEEPRAAWKLIDLGAGVREEDLVRELCDWTSDVVALRGDRRWRRVERPLPITDTQQSALRRGGVYVLTGGLGGIGLELAIGMARTGLRPKLLLLGRAAVPDPDERRRRAASGDSRIAALNDNLAQLDALGAQWRAMSCDVADLRALRRAVDVTTAHFGQVNGVLHLAGVAGDGMLHFRGRQETTAVLDPKVVGTANLFEVFASRPELDFFVMLSSRAAVGGLRGGGDYSAANAVLDAFAVSGELPGCRVLSIGSPAWRTVGMAVPTLAAGTATRQWVTDLAPDSCPVLDEHRVDGQAVLPGTAHLDLVLRAFRTEVLSGDVVPVRVDDVVFLRPLVVVGACRFIVDFEPAEPGWRFTVCSSVPGVSELVHVTGRIDRVGVERRHVDLAGHLTEFSDAAPPPSVGGRLFTLGPRWANVARIHRDAARPDEKLVELRFPEMFVGEVGDHAVHPTLLDSATAYARDAGRDGFHLPFMYRSMTVHEPLPARFYSHIRRIPGAQGSIVADIDLIGEDGRVLVEIAGYTMREVAAEVFAETREARAVEDTEQTGIDPRQGVSLILDLIAARTPRHVLVRPFRDGVPVPIANATQADSTSPAQARGVPRLPKSRRAIQSAHVSQSVPTRAPRRASSVEDRLRELWRGALGLAAIERDDDFFALGGNSLVAVDLMTQIRDEFALDLSIAALFDFPTLGELADELIKLGAR